MEEPNLQTKVDKMSEQIDQLFQAICGNEKMGLRGLVEEVRCTKEDVAKLKALKWQLVGAACVVGFLLQALLK